MAKREVQRRKLTKSPIGDMRDRISLERRVTVPPQWDNPENTIAYTVIAEVWAKVDTSFMISSGQGDQNYNGVDLQRKPAYKFTVRYRDDIRSSDTVIRWRDQLYKIDDVGDPEKRQEYLVLVSMLRGDDDLQATQ